MVPTTPNVQSRLAQLMWHVSNAATNHVCRRCPGTHECAECGGCCERVIPLSNAETAAIKAHIACDPGLRKYILALNKGIPLRMCPFLDFTRGQHKCMLYQSDVLPLVCRHYTCDPDERVNRESHIPDPSLMKPVDMWHTFFWKATRAPDISEAWKLKDLMSKFGFSPEQARLSPELLPNFFMDFPWIEFAKVSLRIPLPPGIRTDTQALSYLKQYAAR